MTEDTPAAPPARVSATDPTDTDPTDTDRPHAGRPGRPSAATAWVRSHPGLVALALLPPILFGAPALAHRFFLDGDNLIQNYPLRILVGRDLAHGHLPLWNPYLYSGTPLLAGFNAGAAYPLNWLYAVVPSTAAWTFNLALAYDAALIGTYLMLRRFGTSSTAATFGAAAFTFGGFMSGQIVHIDIIGSAAWVPWMLLAVHALTEPPERTVSFVAAATGPWALLLAVALGLSILSAGVEAFIDGGILVVAYAGYRTVSGMRSLRSPPGAPWAYGTAASLALGLTGGIALGAAQWLPGLAFVGQSQRNGSGYSFFGTGSLPVRTVSLLVSPFLLGTNQNRPAYYVGQYNFPEVTSYVGALALVAACTLLAARWRRGPEGRSLRFWFAVLGGGMLAALGTQTPFGFVLYVIPGVNAQRLLNRNLLLVDLALAVLLAWFVHALLERRGAREEAGGPRRWWAPGRRRETVLTCLPLGLAVVATVLLWLLGARFQQALGAQFAAPAATIHRLGVVVTIGTVITAIATWLVLDERRIPTPVLRRLLAGTMAVDLGFFTLFVLHPPVGLTRAHARTPAAARLAAVTGNGRFAIYDPDQFEDSQLLALGQTDLNVIRGLPSAQGYAALVGAGYYAATGAHYQEDLDPSTLAGTTWDRLDTRVLLSLPGYFVTPVPGRSPAVTATPFPGASEPYTGHPTPVVRSVTLRHGQSRTWYFGGVLATTGGTVPVAGGRTGAARLGLVTPTGGVRWLTSSETSLPAPGRGRGRSTVRFHLPTSVPAAGLVVSDPSSASAAVTVGVPTVVTVGDGEVRLDGRLQYAVTPPHWVFEGTIGSFGVFSNTRARGWAWAAPLVRGPLPPRTSVTASPAAPDGTQRILVRAGGPVRLVRSMAWSTGWQATVAPVTGDPAREGAPTSLAVRADGVVQSVALPSAGTFVVTFTYRDGRAVDGIAVSAAGAVVLAAWFLLAWRRRLTRRRQPGGSSPMASAARR